MDPKLFDYLSLGGIDGTNELSRATSPGIEWHDGDGDEQKQSRLRPRTYPYFRYLPYDTEDDSARLRNLNEILKNLYISIEAGDFAPGTVHWSKELRSWLTLKFDPPRHIRVKLAKLYFSLALAPGLDPSLSERFASMFMLLIKRKHYLRPGKDLILDWRPLFRELRLFVLPQESGFIYTTTLKRNIRTLKKMCTFCQLFTDPSEIPAMFEEFLPYFSVSFTEGAFIVVGLLNLLMPTSPAPKESPKAQPSYYLPTLFHLWSLVNRSRSMDVSFLDLLSRIARDSLSADHVNFGPYGVFSKEQSFLVFTAVLRLLEIPVGQSTTPYSGIVDAGAGLAAALDKDQKKHPVTHHIARWVVMSLSSHSLTVEDSILANLEGLIQAVETFFHPSNSGNWTKTLAQLAYYLSDFFVMRWNRERSKEIEVPEDRRLTADLKKRFVLALREVVFMGIYAKSGTAMNFSLQSLQSLAYLEPDLILPGALQRIYPSIQGLVEVHRTTSSLRSLQVLTTILAKTKGYRVHITTLLALALPGIDANDLDKTMHTLAFIQAVAYNVPIHDLSNEDCDKGDFPGHLASDWVGAEVEKLEREGADVSINYEELDDAYEAFLLRSSTAGFGEILLSFLGKVFTLLENLPDATRVRNGSPEELVVNTLPAAFMPLLAALSPDLYDIALNKIADFVSNHVIHQARDAMAFICDSLCKVNPSKALKRLIPVLVGGIKTEIDENGAATTRHNGSDVLPRDRGLVWNVTILSMCVVHVGEEVLKYKVELLDIADFMQKRCKGIPAVHVSNFIHHLLLNLTVVYTLDYSLVELEKDGSVSIGIDAWGKLIDPQDLNIKWHVPSHHEIEFAVELFQSQAQNALDALTSLISNQSAIKMDGTGKEWSDEVCRNLVLLRLLVSGVSFLFDTRKSQACTKHLSNDTPAAIDQDDEPWDENEESIGEAADNEIRQSFNYPAGYFFRDSRDPLHAVVHNLRNLIGEKLHEIHLFLTQEQPDDVACFNALYTAYRSWFVDVGIEKSAQVLERVLRLFASDIHLFKVSGLRKAYPRPLLLRRANLYHLQRVRHNSGPRPKQQLDDLLLLDLAASSVSLYTEIRRHAQSALESAVKVVIGARSLVIPSLLEAFEQSLKMKDYRRMKGAMFSLLYGSLAKTTGRDWRFAPRMVKAFISASTADKPSIQKLATGASYQVMEYGRPLEKMVIVDKEIVELIAPAEDVFEKINRRYKSIVRKKGLIEGKKADLAIELIEIANGSHWKTASRAASIVVNMGLRFDQIAPESMIKLFTEGAIDNHPGLRGLYCGALVAVFCLIELRATCSHKFENYLLDKLYFPTKLEIQVSNDDNNIWTRDFLASFSHPSNDYFVDIDHPGWLVWGKSFAAHQVDPTNGIDWDEMEIRVRKGIGSYIDREWYSAMCKHLKQEPREGGADRFRMASAMLLQFVFELMREGHTKLKFADVTEETDEMFGDGSDKHQHRATAEVFGSLISSSRDAPKEQKEETWNYTFPKIKSIFEDGLNPENLSYWSSFLHLVMQGKDPRRSWPILDWLSGFRLDLASNAAFKESSKIQLLQQCIVDSGWHYQLHQPILDDFLANLDHPYKGVREAMGQTLGAIYRTRYHESYASVTDLMDTQCKTSSVGAAAYVPPPELAEIIEKVFAQLATWREQRSPGQQSPSSYTSGSKTVLLWLDTTLSSCECTQLVRFFPNLFMEEMLHMMDVKEDPELMTLAYHVFRHLPNIPHAIGEDDEFINALVRIGTESRSWHQRLRVLINMQVVYFRRLFLLDVEQQRKLFDCVSNMLVDPQLEVRIGAATTLSGMIRCSPVSLRKTVVLMLKKKFTKLLIKNPLPRRSSKPGTPTPEQQRTTIARHAAVLGLGSLVQAFPYASPPPSWLPEVLATLAVRAASDPGMVGKSVKTCLSDFKKTRQDTWHVDVKAFSAEQLEDLEGVLWKSYFA